MFFLRLKRVAVMVSMMIDGMSHRQKIHITGRRGRHVLGNRKCGMGESKKQKEIGEVIERVFMRSIAG